MLYSCFEWPNPAAIIASAICSEMHTAAAKLGGVSGGVENLIKINKDVTNKWQSEEGPTQCVLNLIHMLIL